MTLEIGRYTHVPLYVDAVQVTEENMSEAATWCEGNIATDSEGRKFIRVAVTRPNKDRQTMAYVGDWVIKTAIGLKVYTKGSFAHNFVSVSA